MVNTLVLPFTSTSKREPRAEVASPSNSASTSSGDTTATGRWLSIMSCEMPRPYWTFRLRISSDAASTGFTLTLAVVSSRAASPSLEVSISTPCTRPWKAAASSLSSSMVMPSRSSDGGAKLKPANGSSELSPSSARSWIMTG